MTGDGPVGSGPAPIAEPGYHLGNAETPAPTYPPSARRRGREGRVVIRLLVDRDGRPAEVTLVESSGDAVLDEAALRTLSTWRLRPATSDGRPVQGTVLVPIVFRLT